MEQQNQQPVQEKTEVKPPVKTNWKPRRNPSGILRGRYLAIVVVLTFIAVGGILLLKTMQTPSPVSSPQPQTVNISEDPSSLQEARIAGQIRDKRDVEDIKNLPLGYSDTVVVLIPSYQYVSLPKDDIVTVPIEVVVASTTLEAGYFSDSYTLFTDKWGQEFGVATIQEFYPLIAAPGNYALCYAWTGRTFPQISFDLLGCVEIRAQEGQQLNVSLALGSDGLWIEKQNTEQLKHPQPLNMDTSRWKTYRNEEFGFEVKYPDELLLEDLRDVRYPDSLGAVIRFPNSYLLDAPFAKIQITIDVRERSCRRSESSEDTYQILKNVTINEASFQVAIWSYMPPSFGYEYSTEKGNVCYKITLVLRGNDQKLFFDFVDVDTRQPRTFFDITDQILSTFRFIK